MSSLSHSSEHGNNGYSAHLTVVSDFQQLGDVYFSSRRERLVAFLADHYELHPDLLELAVEEAMKQAISHADADDDVHGAAEKALMTVIRHCVLFSNTLKNYAAELFDGNRLEDVLPRPEYDRFHGCLVAAAGVLVRNLRKPAPCCRSGRRQGGRAPRVSSRTQ